MGVGLIAACGDRQLPLQHSSIELPQDAAFVCLKVFKPDPTSPDRMLPQLPEPVPLPHCSVSNAAANLAYSPYQLFALVMQGSRNGLAVVNLSTGVIVDVNQASPGVQAVPIGNQPTGIATSPDGRSTLVTTAEPGRYALWVVDNARILGDSQGIRQDPRPAPPLLTEWMVCGLPQPPMTVLSVPRAPSSSSFSGTYDIAVILQSNERGQAKALMIDPDSLKQIPLGQYLPCPLEGAIELAADLPENWTAGPSWPDGIPYASGGITLDLPQPPSVCSAGWEWQTPPNPFPKIGGASPQPRGAAFADRILYISDGSFPLIHRIDLSNPKRLVELQPLIVTSMSSPDRQVSVGPLAVSPITSDYRRYLYGIESDINGNILVYDITQPDRSPLVPLTNPYPVLNPLQSPDRISFEAPAVAISFVSHDVPVTKNWDGTGRMGALTGLLCNPNPNAFDQQGNVVDWGAFYRPGEALLSRDTSLLPNSLRGVFAFVALTNGSIQIVNVDDWDAPCRRPVLLTSDAQVSSLSLPQPVPSSLEDTNPFHAPRAEGRLGASQAVTGEIFFPIISPHTKRSKYLFSFDLNHGGQVPYLLSPPKLFLNEISLPIDFGEQGTNPILLQVQSTFAYPHSVEGQENLQGVVSGYIPVEKSPGILFSLEDPSVHNDDDWTIVYEGQLPGFEGIRADMSTNDDFHTLTLTTQGVSLCSLGVHDVKTSLARAQKAREELAQAVPSTVLSPSALEQVGAQMGDYVQIADDLLPGDNSYWNQQAACWDLGGTSLRTPAERYHTCEVMYGAVQDQSVHRDFPILEAYSDHLVLGTFYGPSGTLMTPANRQRIGARSDNVPWFKLLYCCFQGRASFRVRTGGQWIAIGKRTGYLHHVGTSGTDQACVDSCLVRDALLNARIMEVPRTASSSFMPSRNSVLALRNPFFSFFMMGGMLSASSDFTASSRDMTWKFSTRGGFSPLRLQVGVRGGIPSNRYRASPRSIRFIEPYGRLLVIDGAGQGLQQISLDKVDFMGPSIL
ncbi:hypothetical protein BCY86_00965 [Pajaroellobacter abortibovis]|uniref:Uncharacterized protein n=2 Tax=Pajaroellobacter abortibovis TaxID=1882918 RepID=A0A1L6MVB8_9BACT|nr:hypothetical protein BCY86_00965 [Pajaroellobacter abortibovis]